MAEIVNLRLARKQKAREERQQRAAGNRIRHGEAADAKAARRAGRQIQEKRLEGHLRQVKFDAPQ